MVDHRAVLERAFQGSLRLNHNPSQKARRVDVVVNQASFSRSVLPAILILVWWPILGTSPEVSFEDRTQEEIGQDLGVTQMQVSRLLSRILGTLREELRSG